MFGFLRFRRKRARESFRTFLLDRVSANPTVSIEEVLDDYIRRCGLAVRHSLSEPQAATGLRTRLHILEELLHDHPECGKDPDFQKYLSHLRMLVETLDTMPPEVWKSGAN